MKVRNKKKNSGRFVTVLLVLLMCAGVAIMAYPSFSNWYNNLHQSRAIADYNRTVSSNDSTHNQEIWEEAVRYNEDLAKTGVNFALYAYNTSQNGEGELAAANGFDVADSAVTNGIPGDESETAVDQTGQNNRTAQSESDLAAASERYESTLDVSGTGIMGYIDIDKVDIHLPIYHDSSEGVLQVAVGHIAGTSLPVGGVSSHCVLTGHTGLPSAKLFTDIDQLEIGDTFRLVVLDHTLTYEVNDIQVVLPSEVDSLAIRDGEDLCTLVTCTPYGINTHRLLVTGRRVETSEADDASVNGDVTTLTLPSTTWMEEERKVTVELMLPYLVIAAAAVAAVVIFLVVRRKHKASGTSERGSYRKRRSSGTSEENPYRAPGSLEASEEDDNRKRKPSGISERDYRNRKSPETSKKDPDSARRSPEASKKDHYNRRNSSGQSSALRNSGRENSNWEYYDDVDFSDEDFGGQNRRQNDFDNEKAYAEPDENTYGDTYDNSFRRGDSGIEDPGIEDLDSDWGWDDEFDDEWDDRR